MGTPRSTWRTTSHDWAKDVETGHVGQVRAAPAAFAPAGALHLVLEALAYAADEAAWNGAGRAVVTLHRDGSVSVADNGRGTDTRVDDQGVTVKKPAMTTKDLRFFDDPRAASLPDGHPRRGLSVITALSEWLVHTNRRGNGAWTQRYEHGLPVTALTPVPGNGQTGTAIHFLVDPTLVPPFEIDAADLRRLAAASGPHLTVQIIDERG
jgi:DNA gyrase subunit B